MSQHSEERRPKSAPANAPQPPSSAQILPFERPQTDLQRAIQLRAREALDRDRDRDREVKKPQPLKWLIVLAIAAIPVFLMFGAVDGFVRVFHKVNEMHSSKPAPAVAAPVPQSSRPGVVMLQPYTAPVEPKPQASESAPSAEQAATEPKK